MELSILAVILGFILDLIVGDPHWLYHPIRLVGHLISGLEKILRKVFPKTERGELTAGVFLLILTAGITSGAAWILLYAAGCIHPYVKFALSVLMCYQLLATKSLKTETMKVYDALKEGDLKKARYAVSMVVGRDWCHQGSSGDCCGKYIRRDHCTAVVYDDRRTCAGIFL